MIALFWLAASAFALSHRETACRSPEEMRGKLTVHFQGEEGIDAGGLTREWYQVDHCNA